MAAELQLIAAEGVNEHPFVTAKVTIDAEGSVHFDAFQVDATAAITLHLSMSAEEIVCCRCTNSNIKLCFTRGDSPEFRRTVLP